MPEDSANSYFDWEKKYNPTPKSSLHELIEKAIKLLSEITNEKDPSNLSEKKLRFLMKALGNQIFILKLNITQKRLSGDRIKKEIDTIQEDLKEEYPSTEKIMEKKDPAKQEEVIKKDD